MSDLFVLFNGYSKMSSDKEMLANCSCSLIIGQHNIIVDTMTAWDSDKIIKALQFHNILPNMINYVISTHGHSDHIGNNNLFLHAKHIVGFSISYKERYFLHAFDQGERYSINESVEVLPTPGHTLSDVTVLVKTNEGTVAVAGDLFENSEDIETPSIWKSAGSENPILQRKNRLAVAEIADWIVPGHGSKFKVTQEIIDSLRTQLVD
ncbi:unnamed protein product [Chilo suppressalis]|uniref:Metallo-beta-lactamase domain-containing protein 1 n=1 Tax=Chilo suppressalis TaxID=168631 RepID=A0ABN8BER6_CHISP|nr:hypothetical protein evm_007029 [Chilo suppressalis]CAH0405477.1 unnamed protein product [Chilo suppressalis]